MTDFWNMHHHVNAHGPEPLPVPTVTVRREAGRHPVKWSVDGLTEVIFYERQVPTDQIPDGWEVVPDE